MQLKPAQCLIWVSDQDSQMCFSNEALQAELYWRISEEQSVQVNHEDHV